LRFLWLLCSVAAKEIEILGKYLPENSIQYCYALWCDHSIQFKITRPRKTIYGNYFYKDGAHHVSVNGNLQKEAFLVTYIHEVAHLLVRKKYRKRLKPHGKEWQSEFSALMQPLLRVDIFRSDTLEALIKHMKNPAASSCTDPILHELLSGKEESDNLKKVSSLQPGQSFRFQGRDFVWLKNLRTRIECRCLESGRIFRISGSAFVEIGMELSFSKSSENSLNLSALPIGKTFSIDNKKFRKLEMKRTRVLCLEIKSGIKFLIHGSREIIPVEI
jgi:SprT protein